MRTYIFMIYILFTVPLWNYLQTVKNVVLGVLFVNEFAGFGEGLPTLTEKILAILLNASNVLHDTVLICSINLSVYHECMIHRHYLGDTLTLIIFSLIEYGNQKCPLIGKTLYIFECCGRMIFLFELINKQIQLPFLQGVCDRRISAWSANSAA